MTTAARLVSLSGLSGVSAAAHVLAIRLSGATAGSMLVSRSTLGSGSALAHLLDGGTTPPPDASAQPGRAAGGGRASGPDAQITMADYLKRFGKLSATPRVAASISASQRTASLRKRQRMEEEIFALMEF